MIFGKKEEADAPRIAVPTVETIDSKFSELLGDMLDLETRFTKANQLDQDRIASLTDCIADRTKKLAELANKRKAIQSFTKVGN